jgi:tRNA(fMet)-specific endonuclease VapC
MRFVLDTNTLIYFFKGVGNVPARLLSTPPTDIAIPTIVIVELEFGLAKSKSPHKRRLQLQEFSSSVAILPFGINEAQAAASIRADLESTGKPIGPYDLLIAASAVSNNAVLVTHNQREFSRIQGLKIEDWY